jgi:hypothetical protein
MMSPIGRCCRKSRKSNHAKNLANGDFWTTPPLRCFVVPIRKSVVVFLRRDVVPQSPRIERISSFRKFSYIPPKDFFDSIGPNAKCRRALNLSAFRGIPEVMAHVQRSGGISKLNLDGMFLIDSLCGKFLSSSQLLTHPPRQGVRSVAMAEATLFRKTSCACS